MAEAVKYLKIGETYWTESPTGERKVVSDIPTLQKLVSGVLPATPTTLRGVQPEKIEPVPEREADATSSFIKGITKTLEAMAPPVAKPPPTAPEGLFDTELALRQRDIGAARIKQATAITREEIEQAQRLGYAEIERARELLQLQPIAVRNQIERFQEGVEKFAGNISRSLERLNLEEQAALEQNDLQYLRAVRQAKIDAYNMATDYWKMQRQIQMDAWNVMKEQFAMMLSGAQFAAGREEFERTYGLQREQFGFQQAQFGRQMRLDEEKRASDRVSQLIEAAGGAGYERLSDEQQRVLSADLEFLGIPLDTAKSLLRQVEAKSIQKAGDMLWMFDKYGNVIRKIPLPPEATGVTQDAIASVTNAWRLGFVGSNLYGGEDLKNSVYAVLDAYSRNPLGREIMNLRSNLETTLSGKEIGVTKVDEEINAIWGQAGAEEPGGKTVQDIIRRLLRDEDVTRSLLEATGFKAFDDRAAVERAMTQLVHEEVANMVSEEYIRRLPSLRAPAGLLIP